jgi:hypothetical protein
MSDDNNINFPPDFDDLSKHAPLLAKLRLQGDGFVVPSAYFDEIAEKIISLLALPPSENNFIIPENYFENLSGEISSLVQSLDSIENQKSKIKNPFVLPESYFDELDETIGTKLALDNLKQDEGFEVPGNYFENFADKLLTHVAVDELGKGSDADVPPGYFDTLADKIAARIAEEEGIEPQETVERGRIIVFAEVLKRFARPVSIAASVAVILAVSIWFFNRGENKMQDKFVKTTPEKIVPIVIPQVKDTTAVLAKEDILKPEIKKRKKINQPDEVVVKGTDKQVDNKDILEQLYLMDENMVADYITDQDVNAASTSTEGSLNDEMLNYLIENDADPSDINK